MADRTHLHDRPDPVHLVALSGCHTLDAKIRYACEHNRGATVTEVGAWLTRYRVTVPWAYLSDVVTAWQSDNGPIRPGSSHPAPASRADDESTARRSTPDGALGFYLVALLSLAVSFDTAWRFFGDVLGITTWERPVMFAVVEAGLIACGYGMRATVRRTGRPGPARLWVWVLCGLAGYMALVLSGPVAGLARVALGPALGLVMLHLALGIEIRAGEHTQTTTWARIGRELRERLLSRLGLADDERDALARTRDRAARRAARLARARFALFRTARVARAVARSNVAHDPAARARMLDELAAIQHAAELATLDQPSPWQQRPATGPGHDTPGGPAVTTAVAGHVAGPPTGQGTPATGRVDRPARSRTTRRTPAPASSRNRVADYVAEARDHLGPGVVPTPAWVRDVFPGIARTTSQNVAAALKADLGLQPAEQTDTADPDGRAA